MKLKLILLFGLTISLSTFAVQKKAPTLKSVMQGLTQSMNDLNKGIFNEDYNLIEQAASKIANHPKPKSQLPTVIKTLNIRMPQFKGIDKKVHGSAMSIIDLAKKKDMSGILTKHKVIMNNCVACHTQFRSEISRALLEK